MINITCIDCEELGRGHYIEIASSPHLKDLNLRELRKALNVKYEVVDQDGDPIEDPEAFDLLGNTPSHHAHVRLTLPDGRAAHGSNERSVLALLYPLEY